jgi:hypothetical protein
VDSQAPLGSKAGTPGRYSAAVLRGGTPGWDSGAGLGGGHSGAATPGLLRVRSESLARRRTPIKACLHARFGIVDGDHPWPSDHIWLWSDAATLQGADRSRCLRRCNERDSKAPNSRAAPPARSAPFQLLNASDQAPCRAVAASEAGAAPAGFRPLLRLYFLQTQAGAAIPNLPREAAPAGTAMGVPIPERCGSVAAPAFQR